MGFSGCWRDRLLAGAARKDREFVALHRVAMLARMVAGDDERSMCISMRAQRLGWPCKVVGELMCSIAPFGYRPGLARAVPGLGKAGSGIDSVVDYIQRQIIAEIERPKSVPAPTYVNKSPGTGR